MDPLAHPPLPLQSQTQTSHQAEPQHTRPHLKNVHFWYLVIEMNKRLRNEELACVKTLSLIQCVASGFADGF